MSFSSNPSTHHVDSPNSKSKFYQAAKAKLTSNPNSSPSLKGISSVSISFPTSLLVSPQNNEKSISSTLRFLQNTTKPANSEPNSAKRTTPTAGSSSAKTPRSPMSLNFNNIKHMPGYENKSLNSSARTTSHEKKCSEAKRSTPNSGLRARTETDDMEIINQLYFSVTDKVELGTRSRDLSNNSINRSKNSNQEKGGKSPMSSSRVLSKRPSKIQDRTSKSPISRESSKREISTDIKGKRLSLKKEPSALNSSGQKSPLRDSTYDFESRKHSQSYSESWEQFMESNREQFPAHSQRNKLKSDLITLENIENPTLDSLIQKDQKLSQFESRNPAFKTRVEELQYEKEQDSNQSKNLHGEVSTLQNRVKTPQTRSILSETQTTEPSPKSPSLTSEDLKQKEIDMLKIQNENFRMTIEFLKNENHILKEAQRQSLQYKEMAIKYKELAETKIKECYILAEEVITLRKDAQSATSCVLKPLYSDLSLGDPKIEPISSRLESLQIPSFPQASLDKVPESFAVGKSAEFSAEEQQPTQQNEEVPNPILSQIQPQPMPKNSLKFNIYGRRGEP